MHILYLYICTYQVKYIHTKFKQFFNRRHILFEVLSIKGGMGLIFRGVHITFQGNHSF